MAIRIVVVEDHDALRRLTLLWIEDDARFEVVGEAADGLEAIEAVTAQVPDAVLLDLALPQLDGLSAIPFLRSAAPGAPIVVYSNHDEYGRLAARRGAAAVIPKTQPLSEVLDEIARLVASPPG